MAGHGRHREKLNPKILDFRYTEPFTAVAYAHLHREGPGVPLNVAKRTGNS